MTDKKPEPNVYMDNTDSLIQALDNTKEMSPEEIKAYQKKINLNRVEIPRKGKKKKEDEAKE